MVKAVLTLEDGTTFEGSSFGAKGEKVGRIVFNTGVVGYQELLTDPAYNSKILAMSYPLIGNYGIYDGGFESDMGHALALVVKENSKLFSNWGAKESLEDFMEKNSIVGIEGIDTRDLVIHIRENGEMNAIISTNDLNKESLIQKAAKGLALTDLISKVTCKSPYCLGKGQKASLIDLGVTKSLLNLISNEFEVHILPATITAEQIIKLNCTKVIVAGGPEDITHLKFVSDQIKNILGKIPVLGLGTGNLALASALGAKLKQMKVGHHGSNIPVKNNIKDKDSITVQNHSFVIDSNSLGSDIEVTEINLHDNSIEAVISKKYNAIGVQYYPSCLKELI